MSRTGALVRFDHLGTSEVLPQVGETALLEIALPTSPSFAPRFLQCKAVVVRVQGPKTEIPTVAFELRRVRVEERHTKASVDGEAIDQIPAGSGRVH